MSAPRVILASTSPYRGELLHRLLADFEQRAPHVDEAHLAGETPGIRAVRLARAKAEAVAAEARAALVIGSDQVAEIDGQCLDKPGDEATARAQLKHSSGRQVGFHTAVCIVDTRPVPVVRHEVVDLTRVYFRTLDAASIDRYVERERPLDCAGSFKCEALGISLFEHIETRDPTALIGLPLIAVARLLRDCGLELP